MRSPAPSIAITRPPTLWPPSSTAYPVAPTNHISLAKLHSSAVTTPTPTVHSSAADSSVALLAARAATGTVVFAMPKGFVLTLLRLMRLVLVLMLVVVACARAVPVAVLAVVELVG